MFILLPPYKTDVTLAQRPVVTYIVSLLCIIVFLLQTQSSVTELLLYYPTSWDPLRMLTSSLVHADVFQLLGNFIFFMVFAPVLEVLIGNRLRYVGIMLLIAVVVGVSYSILMLIGGSPGLPMLGLSGVVMGVIGLSAYLMPHVRIRAFYFGYFDFRTIYPPFWFVAVIYIGLDALYLQLSADYGGIHLVAHVLGGIAGYAYGYLWLQQRREEISEELNEEIALMAVQHNYSHTRLGALSSKRMEAAEQGRLTKRDKNRFMRGLYQRVKTHRDSDAVLALLERFDQSTPVHELEALFDYIQQWGPSRTRLCLGRWIIDILDREKRYGRAILIIEKCQSISAQFILPDVSRTLFYAEMALELNKPEVTRNLVKDSLKRYGKLLNPTQCNHLLQKAD